MTTEELIKEFIKKFNPNDPSVDLSRQLSLEDRVLCRRYVEARGELNLAQSKGDSVATLSVRITPDSGRLEIKQESIAPKVAETRTFDTLHPRLDSLKPGETRSHR